MTDRRLLWLAAALALTAALLAIDPLPVGVFYDDAQYVILAKAIATGSGYRFLNLPGAPFGTHFPPGYPLLLAVLWRLSPSFPENVALFKVVNAILLGVAAAGTFRFARRRLGLPAPLAFVATVAGTMTIPVLVLSSGVMSEPLFLALVLPLLSAIDARSQPNPDHDRAAALRRAILIGVAIGGVTLVRSHAIALLPAAAVLCLVRRRRREALALSVAALLLVAPWSIWVQQHDLALPAALRGAYGSYTGWLASGLGVEGTRLVLQTIPDNLATIAWTIARCLTPAGPLVFTVLALAAFLTLTVAAIPTFWREARGTLLFVALYLVIVVVWPFSPLRFVWGIWPLLMLFPSVGARALWIASTARAARWPPRRLLAVAAALILGVGTAWFNAAGYANAWWATNARFHARRILGQLSWVAGATRSDDIVASDAEGAVYLYTGRSAVPITSFTAGEYVRQRTVDERMQMMHSLIERYAPRFVVVTSPPLVAAATRLAAASPAGLTRIDSIPRGLVFRHSGALAATPTVAR